MSELYVIEAQTRSDVGRGASRRLRYADQVPAIIYGADQAPVSLTLSHNEMMKQLKHESFYTRILTVTIDGKKEQAVLKALQRHPVRPRLLHVDFLRIKAGEVLHMKIPFHFVGEETCPGVVDGGKISHLISSIEIACLPQDLPEYIEVDVSKLALDASIHLSEIPLPKNVKLVHEDAEHDQPVVTVHIPKESKEDLAADALEAQIAAEQHVESGVEEVVAPTTDAAAKPDEPTGEGA